MKIVIIGPAYPLRGGGMSTFNERLAKQFQQENDDVTIYTFSLQYPSFLFPGTSQYSSEAAPAALSIKVCINSINPFNWIKIGNELKNLKPEIVVVRYWLPFMAPCLGTILRLIKKNRYTKIICIADNILPHEKRIGDKLFTKYFIKPVDSFITMSAKVLNDLKRLTDKQAQLVVHPLYDNFGEPVNKADARKYLGLNTNDKVILFFGFIRKYKGLDLLLEAMSLLKSKIENRKSKIENEKDKFNVQNPTSNIKLLIAGEFYEDKKMYNDLIAKLNIESQLILRTDFIPNNEVKYYLSAADFVIQPYRNATQSGVTPLAYHFEKPILVTNVGGLPNLIQNKKVGLVAEPNANSIAENILQLYELGGEYFLPNLREEKKKHSWNIMVKTIKELAKQKH